MAKRSGTRVKAHAKKRVVVGSGKRLNLTSMQLFDSQAERRKRKENQDSPVHVHVTTPSEATDRRALARLAENIWRLERRAGQANESSWAQPVIERLRDDLRDLQVEIIDRTNTPYRDGENVEKLHSDAPDGWTGGLIVIEVINPTIRIGGVVVEHGKVVVGPDENS